MDYEMLEEYAGFDCIPTEYDDTKQGCDCSTQK